jgi:hypothetical protein
MTLRGIRQWFHQVRVVEIPRGIGAESGLRVAKRSATGEAPRLSVSMDFNHPD